MELLLDKYINFSGETRTVLVIQLCSCDEYQQQMSILKLRVISIVMMCIVGLDFRVVLEERYVTDGLLVSTTEGGNSIKGRLNHIQH